MYFASISSTWSPLMATYEVLAMSSCDSSSWILFILSSSCFWSSSISESLTAISLKSSSILRLSSWICASRSAMVPLHSVILTRTSSMSIRSCSSCSCWLAKRSFLKLSSFTSSSRSSCAFCISSVAHLCFRVSCSFSLSSPSSMASLTLSVASLASMRSLALATWFRSLLSLSSLVRSLSISAACFLLAFSRDILLASSSNSLSLLDQPS
mmetsp:Transcript_24097/g.24017  ORF Transcript_24097/g.24017 Transcript_24097/m.24017 type:complete len:211 (-) Transcript_24097:300-932(-)